MILLNSKTDYALRALLDLAMSASREPTQSRDIAHRQSVPAAYLNQLLVSLRRAGLVRSVRGAGGGYVLGKEPGRMTVAEVYDVLQGNDEPARGAGDQSATSVAVTLLHSRLCRAARAEMERTTLRDLLNEVERLDEAQSLMMGL